MLTKAWGNEYRTTTVCVDSYENGILRGRFYNPYLEDGRRFDSLSQFLLELERALDAMEFPKSFTAVRSFAPLPGSDRRRRRTSAQASWPLSSCGSSSARMPAGKAPSCGWKGSGSKDSAARWS